MSHTVPHWSEHIGTFPPTSGNSIGPGQASAGAIRGLHDSRSSESRNVVIEVSTLMAFFR